jgi:hypothetical protein
MRARPSSLARRLLLSSFLAALVRRAVGVQLLLKQKHVQRRNLERGAQRKVANARDLACARAPHDESERKLDGNKYGASTMQGR